MSIDADLINLDFLPDSLLEIVDVVGLEAALKLVEAYGGVSLYIPKKVYESHPLAEIMGLEAAKKLVRIYSGENIMLPKIDAPARQIKHHTVQHLLDQGVSCRNIALKLKYSERRIWQLKAEAKQNKQTTLF